MPGLRGSTPGGVCLVGGSAPGGCLVRGPGPGGGVSGLGGFPACTEADTPPPCGQTHACKNITFARLRCGQ